MTWLFFCIPSPVVLCVLLVTGLHSLWRRHRRLGIALGMLAIAPACFVGAVENRWTSAAVPQLTRPSLRLVHWNVFRGHLGWEGAARALTSRKANIYMISEFPKDVDIGDAAAAMGPDYGGVTFDDMAVIARGGVAGGRWLIRERGLKIYSVTWHHEATDLRIFVVDIASNLFNLRGPRLRRLAALMQKEQPDLVVGDFNSRRRSSALRPLPAGFEHAYDAAGSGWSYTWPVPCPVLAIDQCIIGERITPVMYELTSTLRSDHRMQTLDFIVNADGGD